MEQDRIRLSIVAPAYDEEEVLPYFHRELCRVLDSLADDYEIEILYVDDGSRDGTLALLRGWAAADPRVRYLSFSRNFGHQAAFTAGLEHARGRRSRSARLRLAAPAGVDSGTAGSLARGRTW